MAICGEKAHETHIRADCRILNRWIIENFESEVAVGDAALCGYCSVHLFIYCQLLEALTESGLFNAQITLIDL